MAEHSRLTRERKTIRAMIDLYCREQHQTAGGLCSDCQELASYAGARLDKCPFGAAKTTCANCPVHCYKPAMRERVRVVMRYAGPRMLLRHPWLAVLHLFDGRRKPVTLKGRRAQP